ncbi:unnamed protein product [Thlaspi arvense]|uniref:Myb-like domain-containing protein n=1 Tax=Thlaspi arvense TaxID=13288 RepID=A0AAU9RWN5_THLAR|nr:unnamed protein product [Thlaspi arvense]
MDVTMVSSSWTKKENDDFKIALMLFSAFCPSRFELMATYLRKSEVAVKEHYQDLVEDLLESGLSQTALPGDMIGAIAQPPVKRTIWKKEEHEWFLIGLRRFARYWDKISTLLVSKNRMQVAIYGHQYFSWESSKMQPMKRQRTNDLNLGHTSVNLASRQETHVHMRSQPQQQSIVEMGMVGWTSYSDSCYHKYQCSSE